MGGGAGEVSLLDFTNALSLPLIYHLVHSQLWLPFRHGRTLMMHPQRARIFLLCMSFMLTFPSDAIVQRPVTADFIIRL